MKKYALSFFVMLCFFGASDMRGDGIRLYQESDHAILREMLASNVELLLPGNDLEVQLTETEKYLSSKNYITKVYVKNDKPVAFITYVKEGFKAPILNFDTLNTFDPNKVESILQGAIQLLNVLEEYRHQGIGTALVTDALADMKSKDIKAVMLQTKVANVAARSLYEKVGFTLFFPINSSTEDCFYKYVI